jgi:large subunit ribosomal protein L21
MYAVIQNGGKQYRVTPGDVIRVEKLEAAEGQTVDLNPVLMVSDDQGARIGNPVLAGASVTAKVKSHGRADKIKVFKMPGANTIARPRVTVSTTRNWKSPRSNEVRNGR